MARTVDYWISLSLAGFRLNVCCLCSKEIMLSSAPPHVHLVPMFDRQEQVCLLSFLSFILYSSILFLVTDCLYLAAGPAKTKSTFVL